MDRFADDVVDDDDEVVVVVEMGVVLGAEFAEGEVDDLLCVVVDMLLSLSAVSVCVCVCVCEYKSSMSECVLLI